MKMSRNSIVLRSTTNSVRRVMALWIAVTFLNLSLLPPVCAASPPEARVATGMIRAAGTVTVDGAQATSGQTIFPGSHIITSEDSESIIDLEKLTRFMLSEKTEFTLDFSRQSISSWLSRGVVHAFTPAGLPLNITTVGAELTTDPSQPAALVVQVDNETTKISVESGRVEVRVGGKSRSLGAGEVYATASDSPGAAAEQNNLTTGQKLGIFAAIGTAAAILAVAILGRDKKEPDFGGCVIVSGGSSSVCP